MRRRLSFLTIALVLCMALTLFTGGIALAESSDFTVENGVLTAYNGAGGDVVIPEDLGITSIGDDAFSACYSLISITIPDGVTSVGNNAFCSCERLMSVTIPNSVTSIGDSAFANCVSLTDITIPSSVTSIGENAFYVFAGDIGRVISCYTDSAAHNYAKENGIQYRLLDAPEFIVENSVLTKYNGVGGDVVIPSDIGIISIGDSAFAKFKRLISVTIPDGVTNIGERAFYFCSSLTSITIPSSVTSIGEQAFSDCSSLVNITIPNSVTSIGDRVFNYCKSLMSIAIPDSVTSIGEGAFFYCRSLTSITIPSSVTSIGDDAFGYCDNLVISCYTDSAAHTYAVENDIDYVLLDAATPTPTVEPTATPAPTPVPEFVVVDGVLTAYNGEGGDVVIPDDLGITSIGANAFYDCDSLTSVVIPEGVTSIGDSAFDGCSSLTSVNIPEGVTSIGSYAFMGCSSLTSVNIPEGVTSIGERAFYNCDSLTSVTIPKSVTSIGSLAFNNWDTLIISCYTDSAAHTYAYKARMQYTLLDNDEPVAPTSAFTVVDGVLTQYDGPIDGDLVIPGDRGIKEIGSEVFSYYEVLNSVTIPDGVTKIGWGAFYGCPSLTSLVIPDSVIEIGGSAFVGCKGLTSINIPDGVTTIESYTFSGCSGLTSIDIPDSVTYIRNGAFNYCSGLTSVIIPDGVQTIDYEAFKNCTNLTSITIPDSVTSIGNSAFAGCTNLVIYCFADSCAHTYAVENNIPYVLPEFEVEDGVLTGYNGEGGDVVIPSDLGITQIGTLVFESTTITSIVVPEGVNSIFGGAFRYCESLTSITLPESLTYIGEDVFFSCTSLSSIAIPNNVTVIENGAFRYCYALNDVTIPKSVTTIGGNAFTSCADDLVISCYTDSEAHFYAYANDIQYCLIDNDEPSAAPSSEFKISDGVLTAYAGKGGDVVIPSDLGITAIGDNAFYSCESLVSVVIPGGVSSIGAYAFAYCDNLASVSIPNGVVSIGDAAFYGCSNLTGVTIPEGVTSIGSSAFQGCSGLTSVTIPDSVTNIEMYAFGRCSSLTSVTIPDSVTSISYGAFSGCSSLTSVNISENVTHIEAYAFSACSSLTSVIIPDGVTIIDGKAFASCSSLTSITIPNSVKYIYESAFENCNDLTIYCYTDSYAHSYAVEYGYTYELLDGEPEEVAPYITVSHTESYTSTGAARESFTIETKTDVSAVGMYAENGGLVKKYSGSSYYTDSDDVRTWNFSYDFANDGSRKMTFKALDADGAVLVSTVYPMTVKGLAVQSAAFAVSTVTKGTAAAATIKTNTSAQYLHMYGEGGAQITKWAADGNSTVSGNVRVWNVSYAFNGAGNRKMTFKASLDGKTGIGSGKTAQITVTAPTNVNVTSAAFNSTVAYTKQQTTVTVKTGADAKYLHMYGEGGAQITKWAADGNSTVSGSVRTWTVKYTFSGAGTRTMTFKGSADGSTTGTGKSASILITTGAPTVSYVTFGKSSAVKGEAVTITAKTNSDAVQLKMYAGSALAKTWNSDGNSTVNGTERIWNVTYAFNGAGNRVLTFKATSDGSTMGSGKTANITITAPVVNVDVTSAAFNSTIAYTKQQTTVTVKTGADAKYLHMYGEGGAQITKWAADGNSTVSGSVRTWTVKYTFSGAGTRTMTFKGSADGSTTGTGKSASILITAAGTPAVSYAAFGTSSAAKGESVTITVKTNSDATHLKMYAEAGGLAKTWTADGNSTVNGTERIWNVTYAFNGAGSRKLTFKASSDGSTMGGGKTASIVIE